MAAASNFQMAVEVFYALNDSITLPHAGACSQCYGVSLFAGAYGCVGFMGIAPRRASVNKSLKLARYIRPIGRRNAYNNIRPLKQAENQIHIILLYAFCRSVARSAPFTEIYVKIINADIFDGISLPKAFRNDMCYFGGRAVSDRTAIHH